MRVYLFSLSLFWAVLGCTLPGGARPTPTQSLADLFTRSASSQATPAVQATPDLSTQAAASSTPVFTVEPTRPCYAAEFVKDVTIPDGTLFTGGASFVKTWRFRNAGACPWEGDVEIFFDDGQAMGAPVSALLPAGVLPGDEVDVSVTMRAPALKGTHRGYWRLRTTSGILIPLVRGYKEKSVYVEIRVKDAYAVTKVSFDASRAGSCADGKYVVSAAITVSAPGLVTYWWHRSDNPDLPVAASSVNFEKAGTKTVYYEWATSASSAWVDLYIDEPNHQRFERAALKCP